MRDASDADPDGEIVWLTDPATEARWTGPVAVDVTELGYLVTEAVEAVGQVAVTGTVRRVLRRGAEVLLELGGRTDGSSLVVTLPAEDAREVGVGSRATVVGWLTYRPSRVTLTDAELWSPNEVVDPRRSHSEPCGD